MVKTIDPSPWFAGCTGKLCKHGTGNALLSIPFASREPPCIAVVLPFSGDVDEVGGSEIQSISGNMRCSYSLSAFISTLSVARLETVRTRTPFQSSQFLHWIAVCLKKRHPVVAV